MPTAASSSSSAAPATCQWCGRPITEVHRKGRRRKYCCASCRQRAFEHRQATRTPREDKDAVVLSARQLSNLQDSLFQVRCAAEDVATAVREGAESSEVDQLCTELVVMARKIEKLR
ncbi:hypothetical protein ACUY3K_01990 [Corynebacterium uberis]|uniref:hypothetical protein n=1 Tax=Corynebacterium TaxID=1716 RepID=UPI001D0AB90D|nr:hypothetical protein [Corynebacterium uberis]MCZ9308674.1 hypothetical protein [Corynebacterium sp. c6VSa_13]UDL74313.1 hypothetical protein LH391_03665 [Corynebacterium uberis]UDL76854.1 hypothetical protein LH393_05735 [Corynebacterium uberis]UDL79067.1 hypothetical protein LH394_05725 [Corynebacterium uberis]UDL79305.1 hypothetical protein LH392_06140 [Corynebacterium uberis]